MTNQVEIKDLRGFWFAMVDIDVICDTVLSPTDKTVYAVLCTFSSSTDRRESYPSIALIAQKANCSENTVRSSLKALIERGVIEREERFRDGRQTSCLYKIIGLPKSAHEETRGSNSEGVGVQNLNPGGAKFGRAELEPNELDNNTPLPPIGGESEKVSEQKEAALSKGEVLTREENNLPPANPCEEWFEKFWVHYPRREDKKRARRVFMSILKKTRSPAIQRAWMENLVLRLTKYIHDVEGKEQQYIKLPSTWLNAHDFTETPTNEEILQEEVWVTENGEFLKPVPGN